MLAVLRSDTLALIATANLLDHPMWSVGVEEFQSVRMRWERQVQEKEALLGTKASSAMKQLSSVLLAAEHEVFGVVRVFSDEDPLCPSPNDRSGDDHSHNRKLNSYTRDELEKAARHLNDPHFLRK